VDAAGALKVPSSAFYSFTDRGEVPALTGGSDDLATMLYFSLTTLTTTGYGDIVPLDPLARLLALELEDRRR
jgi:Ion channel